MDRDEFNAITQMLSHAGEAIGTLDLRGYIEALRRDEAFGCFFDAPFTWASRRDICERLVKRAEAALAFRNAHGEAMEQAHVENAKVTP